MKQLMVILLDGIGVFACLFLEAYCVDSYIDGNRVYYNNYYNEAPFIILFITCGIVISLFCYIVKVLFEYLCLLDRNVLFLVLPTQNPINSILATPDCKNLVNLHRQRAKFFFYSLHSYVLLLRQLAAGTIAADAK